MFICANKFTQAFSCTFLSVRLNVIFSTTAKNHGFHFADDMRIDVHMQDTCRKAYIDIRRFSSTCHLLSVFAKKLQPKLDYCDSIFYGSPMYVLD